MNTNRKGWCILTASWGGYGIIFLLSSWMSKVNTYFTHWWITSIRSYQRQFSLHSISHNTIFFCLTASLPCESNIKVELAAKTWGECRCLNEHKGNHFITTTSPHYLVPTAEKNKSTAIWAVFDSDSNYTEAKSIVVYNVKMTEEEVE